MPFEQKDGKTGDGSILIFVTDFCTLQIYCHIMINVSGGITDQSTLNVCRTGGARWRSWLRHYATNRQVAGSIPDGFIGIFQ
jgi:hypothetical protein